MSSDGDIGGLKLGTFQSSPPRRSKLSTKPVVCLSGIPNNTFIVRQTLIVAAMNSCKRPRLPVTDAYQGISGSNQIDSEPRCFNAALYARQFFIVYFVGNQLLMPVRYHLEFKQ